MIMIFDALGVSLGIFFHFFKFLIFWVVSEVKGQKMAQNDKKSVCHASYLRSHTSDDCHLWYIYV